MGGPQVEHVAVRRPHLRESAARWRPSEIDGKPTRRMRFVGKLVSHVAFVRTAKYDVLCVATCYWWLKIAFSTGLPGSVVEV